MKAKVSITNPCSENWNAMLPAENGRFCPSCQKQVIDFTSMSDSQIVAWFENRDNTCGRFLNSQLNRELESPAHKQVLPGIWQKIAASIIFGLSLTNNIKAQGTTTAYAYHAPVTDTINKTETSQGTILLKCRALNYHTSAPAKRLEFEIEGTSYHSVSDQNGRFHFVLPASYMGREIIIKPSLADSSFFINTASFIPGIKHVPNQTENTKDIILYRYPLATLKPVTKTEDRILRAAPGCGIPTVEIKVLETTSGIIDVSVYKPRYKGRPWQRIISFFHRQRIRK